MAKGCPMAYHAHGWDGKRKITRRYGMNSGKMIWAVLAMLALQLVCAGCVAVPGRRGGVKMVAPPVPGLIDGGGGHHGK